MDDAYFSTQRFQMVEEINAHTVFAATHIGKRALDAKVIRAMGKVPRHEFVPAELKLYAYADTPLPIGFDKTISQPFIVALMTDLLDVQEHHTVLEVGTGLGYEAAVLGELARQVYTVEIIEDLALRARRRLTGLGYANIETHVCDGYYGWADKAPFDRIVVAAAPDLIPAPLLNQLKLGGKMVLPAGLPESQQLMVVDKRSDGGIATREVLPVRFGQMESSETLKAC